MIDQMNDLSNVEIPAVRNMTLVDMHHDGLRGIAYHGIILSGTKNQKEIDELRKELEEGSQNIIVYLKTVQGLPLPEEIVREVQEAQPKVKAYVQMTQEIVDISLEGKTAVAISRMPAFDKVFQELEGSLEKTGNMIMAHAQNAQSVSNKLSERANTIGGLLLLLGAAFGIFGAVAVIVTLRKQLSGVVQELGSESKNLNDMAGTLSGSAGELKESVTQQASALQETASSVEEISAMLKKTNESSKILEKSAAESQKTIESGQEAVSKMLQAMGDIHASNNRVVHQFEESNKQITEIVKVIGEIENKTKVINDIVFQTKLLSFNASVEAARAGEHGKGFAVVAEEVGNLAQMSGNAAKEISDMLSVSIQKVEAIVNESRSRVDSLAKESKFKTEEGTRVAEACGRSLDEIVKHTSQVNLVSTEISTAIREQAQGVEEVSKAMNLLSQTTHSISAVSENTLSAAKNLLTHSKSLGGTIVNLRKMALGQGDGQTLPSLPAAVKPVENLIHANFEKPTLASEPSMKMAVGDIPRHDDPRFEDV